MLGQDGEPCPTGAVGKLVHRGPKVTAGFWNDTEATARMFRPYPFAPQGVTGEIVVHSGDYVRRTADGLFYYVSRRHELVKCRGMRVNPSEIESFLLGAGLVIHGVVFAEPEHGADLDVVAVVVPTEPGAEPADLAAACHAGLPSFQRPARLLNREDLSRTGSGKIDRTAVKAAVLAREQEPAR